MTMLIATMFLLGVVFASSGCAPMPLEKTGEGQRTFNFDLNGVKSATLNVSQYVDPNGVQEISYKISKDGAAVSLTPWKYRFGR